MREDDFNDLRYRWDQYKDIDDLVERPHIQKAAPVLCRAYADYVHAKAVVAMAIAALDVTYE